MTVTLESLVPLQADRDELLQLLNLLDTHWHQNEEVFSNRSLATWPQWCEDQGFRFALLRDLALNLETKLNYPKETPNLVQLTEAVGPVATTEQLLESISQHLPQFLEDFDQLFQNCQKENAAMFAQAGGTAQESIKQHPGVYTAAAAVSLTGVGALAWYRRRVRQADEAVDRELVHVENQELGIIRQGSQVDMAQMLLQGVDGTDLPRAELGRDGELTDVVNQWAMRRLANAEANRIDPLLQDSALNEVNRAFDQSLSNESSRTKRAMSESLDTAEEKVDKMAKELFADVVNELANQIKSEININEAVDEL